MPEIKILLVDDHKFIRSGMKSIINTTNHITIIAECSNGKEAINYLKKKSETIDVVLMDITMPEMNGIDATEIITKQYPNIKILALTMHSEEAYFMKMINAGALGYVLKDATREKIIEAINTVYNRGKFYSNEISIKLIDLLLANNKKKRIDFNRKRTSNFKINCERNHQQSNSKRIYY